MSPREGGSGEKSEPKREYEGSFHVMDWQKKEDGNEGAREAGTEYMVMEKPG